MQKHPLSNVTPQQTLRLGTRGSFLARAQSQLIANDLRKRHPGLTIELVIVNTTGDRVQDRPLTEIGGKGLFVKELELALIDGRVDFAVHSYKDVPVTMPLVDESNLIIAAVPEREDAGDAVVLFAPSKGAMPHKARVGTASLRRKCQILAAAPDVTILPLRGNIDTRIKKLCEGEYDVIVLAMAGLKRAGLFDPSFMRPAGLVPAAGQGALAIQCRKDDRSTFDLLHVLNDQTTAACVKAERRIVELLEGDCHSPIAAWARDLGGRLDLTVVVGGRDGVPPVIEASASAPPGDWDAAVLQVMTRLLADGARARLQGNP
ncbi:MAG: hydroxymethylbilane synthase [Chthoniobacterales bacterium]|nr:hydroxymethylbilane synthase [Chthoniobacterales bacterium]